VYRRQQRNSSAITYSQSFNDSNNTTAVVTQHNRSSAAATTSASATLAVYISFSVQLAQRQMRSSTAAAFQGSFSCSFSNYLSSNINDSGRASFSVEPAQCLHQFQQQYFSNSKSGTFRCMQPLQQHYKLRSCTEAASASAP